MGQTIRMKRISAKLKEETVLRLLQGDNINMNPVICLQFIFTIRNHLPGQKSLSHKLIKGLIVVIIQIRQFFQRQVLMSY